MTVIPDKVTTCNYTKVKKFVTDLKEGTWNKWSRNFRTVFGSFYNDEHQIDYDGKCVNKVQVYREQFILHQKHNGSPLTSVLTTPNGLIYLT